MELVSSLVNFHLSPYAYTGRDGEFLVDDALLARLMHEDGNSCVAVRLSYALRLNIFTLPTGWIIVLTLLLCTRLNCGFPPTNPNLAEVDFCTLASRVA